MNNPKYRDQQFAWNPVWVSSLDSPWSVYFKFIYANHVRTDQFIQLSTTPNSRNDLDTWGSVNWQQIDTALGTNVNSTWNKFISKLVHPFVGLLPKDKLLRGDMYFCPRCVDLGLHSPYHQSIFINRCPFHNSWLISGCPECNRRVPFGLVDYVFYPEYQCRCGYPFGGFRSKLSFPYVWPQASQLKMIDVELQKWLNLSSDMIEYFRNRVWIHPHKLLSEGSSTLGRAADYLTGTNEMGSMVSGCRGEDSSHNKAVMWIQREVRTVNDMEYTGDFLFMGNRELTGQLRQVFKSVARYIRRHALGRHRQCVKSIVRGNPDASSCPIAMAYVLTRMLVEGHSNLRDVDNGMPSSRRKLSWPLYSAIDHVVLTTLKERYENVELGHFERFNEIKTVFGYLVFTRFKVLSSCLQKDEHFDYNVSAEELGIAGIDIVITLGNQSTLFVRDT